MKSYIALAWIVVGLARAALGADAYVPFEGQKTSWHDGFDRYDFMMDEQTLAIEPYARPEKEKFGIADPPAGKRRCVVIAPKEPAAGNPWSWQGCYWDHQPQTEVELLRRGFHVAYVSANATLKPDKTWDAWYAFLTKQHGLSAKPAFIGMSRGGEYEYTWATAHPDSVSCIYADNPGGNPGVFARLGELAARDVPLLHVCGSIDPLLGRVSTPIETIYPQFGGRISSMIKEGYGHHPHSLRDPKPIADFIEQSVKAMAAGPTTRPSYVVGNRVTHASFYGTAGVYREYPKEGTFITCRGPLFTDCYDRWAFDLPGVEGTITVIEPRQPAAGGPWVYRADAVGRDSPIELTLLAKGYRIVTGPVPYNADGPRRENWDAVYRHLTEHGLAAKVVMAGAGGAAGDALAWAIANPEKVESVYAVNPSFKSFMMKGPLLDQLEPLAKVRVPVMLVCGSEDPFLDGNARAFETRYRELGGDVTLVLRKGEGHALTGTQGAEGVVEFVTVRAK